jgi:hypothetical protein
MPEPIDTVGVTVTAFGLATTKLKVKNDRVSIALKCASTLTCTGKVSVTAKGTIGATTQTVACGSASFTIAPGTKKKVTTGRVSANCATLLSGATGNTIGAKLTAKLKTDQPTLVKHVTLTS